MIPVLYPSTETTFVNNGLGGLPDAISCVVTEQRNTQGGYYLEMDYPIDGLHYADIAPDRIIYAAPSMGNTPQPFRISRITRPINGIVHIEAPHLCAELQKLTSWGVDTGTNIQGMIYNQFYRARQLGQTVPFWCETDITVESDVTFSHPEPTSLADILLGSEGSVLDVVGGEYEWDGYHIILHHQRGVDSGLEIRYGVNMSDLEAETDATELVTAVVPYWKGTANDADVVVMGDMCSADNASAYAYVRCVPLDVTEQFELEQDQQPTTAQVTAKGMAFINSTSRKLLQTSIKVKYEPTTNGIGERLINLCDTVRVVYPDLNVSSISKVVETRFNVLTEQYDELTIGSIRNNIVDTIAGLISGSAITGGGGSSGGGTTAVTSVNGKTGSVVLNATDVGAMPNTYTAPVTSVNGMTGDVVVSGGGGSVDSVNGQTGVVVLTASDVGAVAAESGKGLSTNDFTTAEKNKLSGIASGAEVNVQADWNQTNTSADDFIKNKPTKLSEFTNDSGFITSASVPKKTSELTNDSGFITAQDVEQNNSIVLTMDSNLAVKRDSTNITGSGIRTLFTQKYDVILYESSTNAYYQQGKADSVSAYFYNVSDSFVTIVTVPSGSSTATKTSVAIGGGGGSGNFVLLWANEDAEVTNADTGASVTGADVADFVDRRLPVFLVDNDEGRLYEFTEFNSGKAVFTMVTMNRVYSASLPTNSNIVDYNSRTITANVLYYIDGTTVKSAETNLAKTGQQINDETLAKGIAPIIYKYESSDYTTYEYHFFSFHSGGLNFRTLDGKKLIFVSWGSSTATITQSPGYSANILFYLDGTTVKYTGTNTAVTGNDVAAMTLANGNLPVIRQLDSNAVDHYYHLCVAHSGGMEFRLLDGTKKLSMTYNSSTATITQEYYAVTLNADGTVNTFDSALTYSAASSSVLNGTSKKLIVTWGNSIFTADANEKLSGANGDVKFIADCEHDGIQRHIIFTLTSANALQTTLIETYSRVPLTVWEVADVTQGLIALNTNISSSLAWQLTGLNLASFKRIKVYVKAGRKTGSLSADSSITPASIIEMSMDNRAKEDVSQNVFIGSSVVQNPNDPNRLGIITCAVSGDKTKFAVVRATTLYGTAATSNTDAYPYVFKIEGYYD